MTLVSAPFFSFVPHKILRRAVRASFEKDAVRPLPIEKEWRSGKDD